MEYVEIAGASTGMLDKFLTSDALARVTGGSFPPAGPSGPAFRAVPLPVFSHVKQSTSPTMSFISQTGVVGVPASANLGLELARRTAMPAAFATTSAGPMNGVSAGMVDIIQVQEPVVEATLQNDGADEQKGKKTREGGGRGSRGGGSRKRTRVGQPVDLLSARGELADDVANRAIGFGRGASGGRQRAANGEKEKTATRRQTGQGAKRGEKKASQNSGTPNDAPLHKNWTGNRISSGSNGILDIYGLKTKPIDLSQYMFDISLNDLLSGNYNVPPMCSKEPVPAGNVTQPSFEQQVSDSFQHMPKKFADFDFFNAGTVVSKEVSQNARMVLDLDCPLHPEEEEARGLASGGWYHAKDSNQLHERVGAEKETSGRAFATPPDKGSGPSSSRLVAGFNVDNLPLYSLEEFLSRLKLPSSDPLELLIAKAGVANGCTKEIGGHLGTSSSDHCRNGSIPPLPFSLPPVGPVKSELDQEKGSKLGRTSQRRWVTGGTSTPSRSSRGVAGSSGLSHKEEPEVTGGESVSTGERKSSSGRRTRKYEKTEDMSNKQDRIQFCSPDGPQTPSPPQETGSAVASKGSLASDEAREVENAVRLSSNWQTEDSMEIDLQKIVSGAVTPLVDNRFETEDATLGDTQTQQAVSADVVRRLDVQMPAAIGEPSLRLLTGKEEENTAKEARKGLGEGPSSVTGEERVFPVLEVKVQEINQSMIPTDPSTSYTVLPGSPNAQAGAHILCNMANSIPVIEQVNPDVEKQRRTRVFSPYRGAPTQRSSKASKNGASGSVTVDSAGEAAAKGGTAKETVSTIPVKGTGSDRRKSLSQFNDASPARTLPTAGARGGLSRAAVGPRSSHNSHRGDKGSKEGNAREGSGNRTGVSSSPGGGTKSTTVFGISRGLGGARNTLSSSLLKEAATVYTKLGAGSKEKGGVDVKGLRPHSNGISHPVTPSPTVAVKSIKQIGVANGVGRHRGGKSSRDW